MLAVCGVIFETVSQESFFVGDFGDEVDDESEVDDDADGGKVSEQQSQTSEEDG